MNKAHLISWSGVEYMIAGFTKYEEIKGRLILYFGRHKMKVFKLSKFLFWEIKEI